jgi:hypothetical protein
MTARHTQPIPYHSHLISLSPLTSAIRPDRIMMTLAPINATINDAFFDTEYIAVHARPARSRGVVTIQSA